jgi:acyl-CoA reductase-like NAD-dependent aldehyde dehydrogenase
MVDYQLWINGEWLAGTDIIDVVSPYDGNLVGRVAVAGQEHVDRAIHAASQAFASYRQLPAHKRSEILQKTAALINEHMTEFASLLVAEAGKPIRDAQAEVKRAAFTFSLAAEEAKRISGECFPLDATPAGDGRLAFTLREPIGVIAAITPFNVPLNLVAHKVAPALAAGNTVVLKPASKTPLVAFRLAELLHEAGLPAGCLNVICGAGEKVGDRLVTDPRIAMVTFTGSPEVGKRIRSQVGLKKVTLELGSNSAIIIEDCTDLEKVVARCVQGGYSFAGQVCISVQRIYVQERLYHDFLSLFKQHVAKLQVGPPENESTDVSAMITPTATQRIISWLQEATANGAHIELGGVTRGSVLLPTIVTNVQPDMKISCEEVFAPVTIVTPYQSFVEALTHVNQSRYGLQAGVFTTNLSKAFQAVRELQVGGVMVNDIPTFRVDQMPYGGVKESGIGREGVRYAIEEMTEAKLAVFNLG